MPAQGLPHELLLLKRLWQAMSARLGLLLLTAEQSIGRIALLCRAA